MDTSTARRIGMSSATLMLAVIVSGCYNSPYLTIGPDPVAAPAPAPAPAAPAPTPTPAPTPAPSPTPPPTPTPAPTVTPESLIGKYAKRGERSSSSNCNPPAFGPSFVADLSVISFAAGSHSIQFVESHGGGTAPLFYSQFEVTPIDGGLAFVSGTPQQNAGGRTFTTQIRLRFAGGKITGTETFTGTNPPCVDEYAITGEKQ